MKIRNGFVSNSSSSSFIIQKRNLTSDQIYMIYNHLDVCYKILEEEARSSDSYSENDPYGEENWNETDTTSKLGRMMEYIRFYDKWSVEDKGSALFTYTNMANFDMEWFLLNIVEVPKKDIVWLDY